MVPIVCLCVCACACACVCVGGVGGGWGELLCLYVVKPLQNAAITRMVWSVKNCAVTVATENRVITWTEVVGMDVTLGFTAKHVIKVLYI